MTVLCFTPSGFAGTEDVGDFQAKPSSGLIT